MIRVDHPNLDKLLDPVCPLCEIIAMSTDTPKKIGLIALSVHQEMGENFVKDLCGTGNSKQVGAREISLDVLAGDPRLNAAWDDEVKNAGGVLVLARFLDVISLDKIKAIYRRLPSERTLPIAVLVVREKDETDFKMSCPVCGQKLWVRDSDANKRGRCPNCKKAFTLPDQIDHLRAQLALPDSVPALRVISGDSASAEKAVQTLLNQLDSGLIESPQMDQNVLKQSTIRVQINPDDD